MDLRRNQSLYINRIALKGAGVVVTGKRQDIFFLEKRKIPSYRFI